MSEHASAPPPAENDVQTPQNVAEESGSSNFTNSLAFILGSIRSEVESEEQLKKNESIEKSNGKHSRFSERETRRDRPPLRRGRVESVGRIQPRQFYQQERISQSGHRGQWRGHLNKWQDNNRTRHENSQYQPVRRGNHYDSRFYHRSRPYRGAHRPRIRAGYDQCRGNAPASRGYAPPENFRCPPPENFCGPAPRENFHGPVRPENFRGPPPEIFRGGLAPAENFRGPAHPENFRSPPAGNFRSSAPLEHFRGQRSHGRHFRGSNHPRGRLNNRMHRPQGRGSFENHSFLSNDQTYDMSMNATAENYPSSDSYLSNYGAVEDPAVSCSNSYAQAATTEMVANETTSFPAGESVQHVDNSMQDGSDYYYWAYDGMQPGQMVSYEMYPQGQPGDDPNYIYYYNTFYIDTDVSAVDPTTGQPITEEVPVVPRLPAEEQQKVPPPLPPTEEYVAKVELSTSELKSLADTVASLENTTKEEPKEENQIENQTKPRPIGEVIESLLNRKKTPTESDMNASFSTVKSEDKSALGMNLDLGCAVSTEGVLDRLESKFASSNEAEKTEDISRMSTMEANLAKAYSHFLQAAENRKRQSETEKREGDSDCAEISPKVSRNTLGDGLGISLDMEYDMDLMIKKPSPSPVKSSPSPIKSSYPTFDARTVGSSFGREQRSPIAHRSFFDRSPNCGDVSPRDRMSPSPPPPRPQIISREASPDMGTAFDDDRLSSSPEAPNVIDDDVDNSNFDAPDDNNFDMSPPSNSRGRIPPPMEDLDPDTQRGRDRRSFDDMDRSYSPPPMSLNLNSTKNSESSLSWNQNSRSANNWKPARKFKYCNKFRSEEGCPAKFERQYPDYYEHYKAEHGLRNGVPCVEGKCKYIARGLENFLNHIKARHPDTL